MSAFLSATATFRAFLRQPDRRCAPDPRSPARNERYFILQPHSYTLLLMVSFDPVDLTPNPLSASGEGELAYRRREVSLSTKWRGRFRG